MLFFKKNFNKILTIFLILEIITVGTLIYKENKRRILKKQEITLKKEQRKKDKALIFLEKNSYLFDVECLAHTYCPNNKEF